jgi:hypothetical protein
VYTVVFLQQTDGASNDKAIQCKYQISDISKCSQKDRPFILPFSLKPSQTLELISLYRRFLESNNMNSYTRAGFIIGITLLTTLGATLIQQVYPAIEDGAQIAGKAVIAGLDAQRKAAPIATSGDNVYIAWWSNKTGNDEVMFKASTDGGKIFGDKINLSNSTDSQSQDVQIAASDNNVYVSWWERNQTMNEPVLRVSNDNGKTFGEKIMLSAK